MPYQDFEEAQYDSEPVELFMFVGTYRTYYLSPHNQTISFMGNDYLPVAGMVRGEISSTSQNEDQGELEIEMPIGTRIVRDYAFQSTPPNLELTIYRVQRETGDSAIMYTGRVSKFEVGRDIATLVVPSRFREMLENTLPTVYVQAPCNHVLFDQRCQVSRAANSHITSVDSVSGREIVLDSIGSFPSDFFVGGELLVSTSGERRTIVSQSGLTVTVNFEFNQIMAGSSVSIAAGCDHSYSGAGGCPKFNNQPNFGGCPFTPGESNNPFSNGIS